MCQGLGPRKHDEISEIDRRLAACTMAWDLQTGFDEAVALEGELCFADVRCNMVRTSIF